MAEYLAQRRMSGLPRISRSYDGTVLTDNTTGGNEDEKS
jgi:hypothetical protein